MNEWTENLMNIGIELGPIVLLTLIAIIFSRTVIYKSLLVYASASDTKHDDAFVNSLKKPLTTNLDRIFSNYKNEHRRERKECRTPRSPNH